MKLKLYNKIAFILICIIMLTISFSTSLVKAAEGGDSSTNTTYVVTTNDTTFQSRSTPGNPINATIMVPNGTTTSIPLVVMCHGYTGNRRNDDDHFIRLGSILAQNGIAAVTIDFPGCGESTASESAYTLSNMYEYVNTAISSMISRYDIDTSKIAIVGHSMGGRVASMYTQEGDYSVAAIALWAPANGDGSMGYDFLNRGSFSFNASQTFFDEMDSSYPNTVLSSYSGSIFLAEDGADANGEGPIDSSIVEQTKNTVAQQGGEVRDYSSTNHNFNDSVGNGGQVVNDTANFLGEQLIGRSLTEEDEEDEPLYNIEDIIFNRIPILDINFFSDTAGGQPVRTGSAVDVIRNSVATWYVSFRNLVIIALAVIIIYIGIRMALSTIPSGKAKYKTMLIGWVQALVIVLVIHWIMILTINTNNGLVDIFEKTSQNIMAESGYEEDSIYETIMTRAYDLRASVSIPATIMYIIVVIIWVKFLWVYIKRSFTILLLIVIAPFIGAKYAIDIARGKKGSSFSSWLYDFVLNVLLQTVHAIVYTVLMTSALKLAFTSIWGYIIALVFMNFMLDADEVFRSIFNFEGRSDLAEESANARKEREQIMEAFAGAVFVGQFASTSLGVAKGVGNFAVNTGKKLGRKIDKKFPAVEDARNNALDWIDTRVENFANENIKLGGETPGLVALQKQAKIRKLSRKKGAVGVKARKLKKSISSHRKKRYKANFKLIKDSAIGSASTILAIPMTVVEPAVGLGLLATGVNWLNDSRLHKKHYKSGKDGTIESQRDIPFQTEKYTKKRDKYYKSVDILEDISNREKDIAQKAEDIKKKVDKKDFMDYQQTADKIIGAASKTKIEHLVNDYIEENKIKTIDNRSINDIIDSVAKDLGLSLQLDRNTRNMINSVAIARVVFLREKLIARERIRPENSNMSYDELSQKIKYTKDDIVDIMQTSITESTVTDNRFKDLTKDLFKLDNKIKSFEDKAKTKYRGANKFLQGL